MNTGALVVSLSHVRNHPSEPKSVGSKRVGCPLAEAGFVKEISVVFHGDEADTA